MKSDKILFLRKAFTYVLSNSVEALIVFLFLPILTRYLTKQEYGILAVYLVFTKFLVSFIHLNVPVGVTLEYFQRSKADFTKYMSTTLLVPVINTLIILLVSFPLKDIISLKFGISYGYIVLLPFFVFVQFLPNIYLSICQVEKKSIKYAIYKIANTLINFILALVYIIKLRAGWPGQILGYFWGYIAFSVLAFFFLRKRGLLKPVFDAGMLKGSYSFGMTLLFHSLSGVVMSMADRIIIQDIKGYDQVGVYAVAYQIGTILTIVSTGIVKSLTPNVYENLNRNTAASLKKIVHEVYLMMAIITVIAVGIYVFKDLIFKLLINKSYNEAKSFILPLLAGLLFQSFYMFKSNVFFYYKKTKMLASLTLTSAILNITLNYVFIYRFGTIGAAYATLVTYLIFWLVTWYLSVKVVKLPWFSLAS